MKKVSHTDPADEQKICVACGICCDGTLFSFAHLKPGERGNLPDKIEVNSYSREGNDYFRLPCGYFKSQCTIYDRQKASVCSEYRCQLLRDFDAGKVTLEDAMEIVKETLKMRDDIIEQYRNITAGSRQICLTQLIRELGKSEDIPGRDRNGSVTNDLLLARCNIFEALLTKYFRSADDFGKMLMRGTD